jgi:hypothetical protein
MKLHVEKQDGGLRIRIAYPGSREHGVREAVRVPESMRACGKRSAWAWPSGECVNIGTMDAKAGDGTVLLALAPRQGEALSEPAIEECLRYVLDQSVRS